MNPVDPTHPVPVAIIGMSCLFPQADGLAGYWANIRRRRDAITAVPETHWRLDDYYDPDPKAPDRTYARRGGFLNPVDFPPLDFGIAPNNLDATDTTQLLGLLVARQALEDAGYGENSARPLDRSRVSVLLGVTGTLELVIPLGARLGHPIWRRALKASGVAEDVAEDVVRRISDSYVGWQENSFPGLLGNVAAGRIANRLDLGGTNCVIDAACASSVGALNLAMLELAAGRCDLALSGGLDTFNDIFMYMCFSKTPALSPRGDARPFDASCDGTVLGEGLGIIALKRLDDARRDGDKIYAVIRSVGSSSDGKGGAVYAPKAEGQAKALRQAYRLAGVSPRSIELVEAHGTGTKVGDATELAALNTVYREAGADGTWCALGSVKSQIGHTKAAAGAAGIIKAALALHHKVLPPTIKVDQPVAGVGPGQSPFYVNTEARPWLPRSGQPRRAAVSAFGFGGSNYHCVLEEAEPAKTAIDWDGEVQLVAFSAASRDGLAAALDAFPRSLDWKGVRSAAAQTRARFHSVDPHRLLLVVDRETDLEGSLRKARAAVTATAPAARGRDGIFLGAGATPGRLAMLFPGQGSQYVGMLRELACVCPQLQESLALADALDDNAETRLSDRVYPFPAFSDEERARQEAALRATEIAQPAIGALSLGLVGLLTHFGITPDLTAGHSYGELTALAAAGWCDAPSFSRLSRERGRLMAEEAAIGGGGMLAVLATLGQVEEVLREERLDLVVANKNAPRQFVLSGPSAEIARAGTAFRDRQVSTRELPVSAAFHSPAVAAAASPFAEALAACELTPSAIPVYSNAQADLYPNDLAAARALLAGQIARPVEFVAEIEAMTRAGVGVFLEVGPDAKLTGLVRSILDDSAPRAADPAPRRPIAMAVDASRGERGNLFDLATVLAELAALGYPIRLDRWDEGAELPTRPAGKPGLTVKISGANVGPRPAPPHAAPAPVATSAPQAKPAPEPLMTPTPPPLATVPQNPRANGAVAPAPVGRNGTSHDYPALAAASHATPERPTEPRADLVPLGGADPSLLAQALRSAQENLVALQNLGAQTADLHRQFLEGQDRAHRTFQSLLEQQQRLTIASLGMSPSSATASAPATPAPVAPRHVPTPPPVVASVPAPLPIPVPVVAPATATPAAPSRVSTILLEVVAEKTGYPTEMLEPSMQLDADLGIDSIKRVEILSALQERLPGAPAVRPEQLGTLRTLQDVADALESGGESTSAAITTPPGRPRAALTAVLLEVVAEKTGYPTEMLELSMQLDADLGIDSIKRVEILSALQERLPDAPAVRPEQLGTLRTLQDVVDALATGTTECDAPAAVASAPRSSTLSVLLEVVAEKTGYPTEMLEPSMQLDADLGIDSIKRVEILSALQERLPDAPAVRPEQLGTLRTLQDVADALGGAVATAVPVPPPVPATTTPKPELSVAKPAVQRWVVTSTPLESTTPADRLPIRAGGEVWVIDDGQGVAAALATRWRALGYMPRLFGWDTVDSTPKPSRLDGIVLVAPPSGDGDRYVASAFRWLRLTGSALRQSAQSSGALVATVARLDGAFGARGLDAAIDPALGGLAGIAKTAGHEWPGVHCRALDLDPALDSSAAAALVADELNRPGPVEVGLSPSGRVSPHLVATPIAPAARQVLQPGEVVVITGGARGVTAEVAVSLAAAYRPTLVLLGRSPAPQAEPDWLMPLQGEAEIKRALAARANGHATPQLVGERFRSLAVNREILQNLARIEAAGGRAEYLAVDVRDESAVRQTLAAIRSRFGTVRALVHGAGVLADRRIDDQTDAQFADVYTTKVDGLRSLLSALGDDDLKALVLFSSTTARLGRTGQVAYAAANEVLNKIARREAARRPDCRVVAVNWGPWDGGMVTPALKPLFASEGVGLIPLAEGARYLVDEIAAQAPDRPTEVVVLGGDSLPVAAPVGNSPTLAAEPRLDAPSPVAMTAVFERPLDLDALPILRSHVIDGRAVLPTALMLEWLAHGAIQRNPGLVFRGVDDLRVLKGAIVHEGRPESIAVLVGKATRAGDVFRVPVELRGTRSGGQSIPHARAEVILGNHPPQPDRPAIDTTGFPASSLTPRAVYHDILFHGPDLHGIERIEALGPDGAVIVARTAPSPSQWIEQPLRQDWLTDPLAIDCAFQLMVFWCAVQTEGPSLPTRVGHYRQFRRNWPSQKVRIVARIARPAPHRATADLLFLDADGQAVARIDDYECVIDASLSQAFRRNRLPRVAGSPR